MRVLVTGAGGQLGRDLTAALGEPEDIALAALYLASPAASWVTGKVLEVDGGLEEPNLDLHFPDL